MNFITKSFIPSFISSALIEALLVYYAITRNFLEFDFTDVFTWIVLVLIPVLVGLITMLIAVIQNEPAKKKQKRFAEKKGGNL